MNVLLGAIIVCVSIAIIAGIIYYEPKPERSECQHRRFRTRETYARNGEIVLVWYRCRDCGVMRHVEAQRVRRAA